MKYKYESVAYTLEEVEAARLVAKNNNGLAFLSDLFFDMCPEAQFFALVRHPLALYESYIRHKFIRSAEAFVNFYQSIGNKMLSDAQQSPNYHLVKFEDMVAEPVTTARQVCSLAGLDFDKVQKIRLKAKLYFNKRGEHATEQQYLVGRHYWFAFNQVADFVEQNINEYQIARLDKRDAVYIMRNVGTIAETLGYI